MPSRVRAHLSLAGCALLVSAVLALLLVPRHVDLPIAWLSASRLFGGAFAGGEPLWWLLEDLANVAMFVPLGWALARAFRRALPAVVIGIGISAACETAQHFIPNRDGSLIDVTMNAIGTGVGVVIAVRGLRRRAAAAS